MNRLRADLILLLVALIWGTAFVVQRVATQYFDLFTFNGYRFLLGAVILFPFTKLNTLIGAIRNEHRTNSSFGSKTLIPSINRKSLIFITLAGLLLFGAGGLQQAGLKMTTAGNAGFITTLYVVIVPILLLVFWREKVHWISWLGAGIAVVGSLLLSTGGELRLAPGDALEMAAALFWALHLILVSRAVRQMDILSFSVGQYFVAGAINILFSLTMHMPHKSLALGWWTIVYTGTLSIALGYTLQVLGQKYAPPTDTTILLSMEAVFAALTGYFFLGETMRTVQLIGCGLILMAVFVTQLKIIRVMTR